MSRPQKSSLPEGHGARCSKDKKAPPAGGGCAPLTDIVLEKQHLAKLALHNTSCAGCIASVRALLSRPLSELRMLKAVVDEHGPSGLRLKDAYGNNPKRTEQLLDAFPMSSVLKKVQPIGSAQRCQLHRRLYTSVGAGSGVGAYRAGEGSGNSGGGRGGGGGGGVGNACPTELWDWEDAWERMPPNLRCEVATIKAPALEAAMHHGTDANRFCSDCKHNVVQAHDILMGKVDLEGSENEEEFDEEMFQPFEDRVFEGEGGNRVLVLDVMDVEDLIYFHEDFSSQDFDSSSGQQRHAATLEQGQREVRSILGALVLSQLRSVWHAQTAQVQGEQYLFCLVVDAVRTMLAAHGAAPHGDDLMAIDAEERCAAEERRQKRRQKRKGRKRAGKAQLNAAAVGGGNSNGSAAASRAAAGAVAGAKTKAKIANSHTATQGDGSLAVLARRSSNAAASSAKTAHHDHHVCSAEAPGVPSGHCESGGVDGGGGANGVVSKEEEARSEAARAHIRAGLGSGFSTKAAAATATAAAAAGSHGVFGAGGLAFQLGCGDDEVSDGDYDVDPDLITEMEQLRSSVRPKSDIDFLRKTLRQNYDRFISQGAGRVH